MNFKQRLLTPTLLAVALVLGFLAAAPAAAAVVYVEGVVSAAPTGDCVLVTDSDGKVYALQGTSWEGIIGNDYVRLEGSYVPVSRCGVTTGFMVTNVGTVWSDNARKVVLYSGEKEGRFRDWARRHREAAWRKWDQERREHRAHERQEEHREPPPLQ